MSERNMACTSHSADMEIDQQGQDQLNPEPSFYSGNNRHYTHPTVYPSSSSGSANLRNFPDTRDSAVFYGSQYNGLHHHNSDFGGFHNPCMVPPMPHSSGVFPAPRVSADQLPSSSRHGVVGGGGTEFGASRHFVDDVRSLSKRKNVGVGIVPGNHQVNGSTSSSSSYLGMLPRNGIGMEQHESRTNGVAPVVGGSAGRSTGSRSRNIGLQMESPMIHTTSYLAHGNYMGHSFQPTMWAEPRFGGTGNDGSAPTWGFTPAVSYLNVHGVPSEVASMGGQGYLDATSIRNSTVTFSPPPPPPMHHHHHFHPSPTMQAMHVHNGYHHEPFQPSLSGQVPSNNLRHGTINHALDDSEPGSGSGSRYPRQLTSNGIQMYRPHRSAAQQTVQVDRSLPYLTYLIEDEVAILEFPDFYVGVGSFGDRHRDMRLDIDHMSYEELLALGERIGNVTKGLTEETIESRLKTRVYTSSAAEGKNQEESCIVCQVEYQPRERIGTLKCGHEYHAECIKRWLQVKNECPVCKVAAINKDDGGKTKGETGCYFYPYA